MKLHVWRWGMAAVLTLLTLPGCRRSSSAPGDPMLDAIRAEEREADLSYAESQGKHLFIHYCATCHGDEGQGDGQNASNLSPPPPDLAVSKNIRDASYLRKAITEGTASTGRSPLSPPWGRSLSPQEIDYLVSFCQSLTRKKH